MGEGLFEEGRRACCCNTMFCNGSFGVGVANDVGAMGALRRSKPHL